MKKISPLFSIFFFLAFVLPATAQLPPETVPQNLGVNIHFTQPQPGEMNELTSAGFKFIRMDFDWSTREKVKGKYNFAPYDKLIHDLQKHGIRAILILDYGNPLYDKDMSPHTDEARQAFARMTVAAVRHFKGRGILWEMWNEPNGFWHPKPNVDDYVKLAMTVGKALKAAEPHELFVGPALAGMDWNFIEKCFQGGCLKYWDAVTVHPYRQQDPETVAPDYARLRAMIAKYAPKGKMIPVISGEWGYSSAWAHMGPARQGKMLAREFLTNLWQHIPLSIWYDWHDDGPNPTDPEHHFGTVLNPYRKGAPLVYEPKPAYHAAKTLTSQLAGFHFDNRLPLSSDRDFCLQFSNANQTRFVAWTRDAKPHAADIPIHQGTYSAVNYVGQKIPDITATPQGATIQLSDGPVYLMTK